MKSPDELFLLNLDAFEQKISGFSERFKNHKPELRAEFRDGDIYIYDGKRLVMGSGYKTSEMRALNNLFSNPCRLITPASKFVHAVEKQQSQRYNSFLKPIREPYALSQSEDHCVCALHTGFFNVDLAE